MSVANIIFVRGISSSCTRYGKRNFRKFDLPNKRGSKEFKKQQAENPDPRYPIDNRGVREIGYKEGDKYLIVAEKIPELIVPNLEGFKLKPYVTYRSEDVYQEEFTPRDLFNAVYGPKLKSDYENNKLTAEGEPLDPSPEEKLTAKEARDLASRTGTDMFINPAKPLQEFVPEIIR